MLRGSFDLDHSSQIWRFTAHETFPVTGVLKQGRGMGLYRILILRYLLGNRLHKLSLPRCSTWKIALRYPLVKRPSGFTLTQCDCLKLDKAIITPDSQFRRYTNIRKSCLNIANHQEQWGSPDAPNHTDSNLTLSLMSPGLRESIYRERSENGLKLVLPSLFKGERERKRRTLLSMLTSRRSHSSTVHPSQCLWELLEHSS